MKINDFFKENAITWWHSALLLIGALSTYLASLLHYNGVLPGNRLSWVAWLFSIFILLAFSYKSHLEKLGRSKPEKDTLILIGLIFAVYFITHLYNWELAPWNNFGLFDDASWDIYFLKNKVLGDAPFQTIYFDDVGAISREVLFHYYVAAFFSLMGYNLQAFNFSLLLLGFVTIFFITLSVYELTKSIKIAIFALFFASFYPLIYTQTFQGHRYAIVPPLITMAYYYALLAYRRRSLFFAVLTGISISIAIQGGVTGKQFLLAGVISLALLALTYRKQVLNRQFYTVTATISTAIFVVAIPLIVYIKFNSEIYAIRENGLLKDFFAKLSSDGFAGISSYWQSLIDLFFAEHGGNRQFMSDYRPIPMMMLPAFAIGVVFAFFKKRYELIVFSFLPVAATLVAGAYDFRIAHAAPFFVILLFVVFIPGEISLSEAIVEKIKYISVFSILLAMFSGAGYVLKVGKDPNHIYLLPHIDVAVSRYMQDLAYGELKPSIEMKASEFNKGAPDANVVMRDFFACPEGAYAIAHLYLKDANDKSILSLCNQSISRIQTEDQLISGAAETLKNYDADLNKKDLVLFWQKNDKIEPIIKIIQALGDLAQVIEDEVSVDGQSATLIVVKVEAKNKAAFKNAFLAALHGLSQASALPN